MIDKKIIEKYKNLILDIPGIKSAEYVNSTTSSVTLSWGIEWSSDYIARDIIQNFRDSNRSEINSINVKMSDSEAGDFRSTMEVSIIFTLKKDPSTQESVQITVAGGTG